MGMEWLQKLLGMGTPKKEEPAPDFQNKERRNARLPSSIQALCSAGPSAAYTVTISDLGVTGVRLDSPRRMDRGIQLDIRVPVGKNFEARDTMMHVGFQGTVMWTRRSLRGSGFEIGVRYSEETNEQRDQWISLVLKDYGFSISEGPRRTELRCRADMPLFLRTEDGNSRAGNVVNLSMGGLLGVVGGEELSEQDAVTVTLGSVGDNPILELSGRVVRVMAEAQEDSYLVGVAFGELDDAQRAALNRCLAVLAT